MIDVKSYKGINNVDFGSKQSIVISVFGRPERKEINREGEVEFHFSGFVVRFDANSEEFRECTLLPECGAKINGFLIDWSDGFLSWLASEDSALKEVHGFVVSLRLGLAVAGFHDNDDSEKSVHAFRYGDWDMFLGAN
ncbi:hypothetical protein [Achromobacter sp. JUb104]|uniref:hypothetical protein n=1 Tax=Achromobacter sp. JUb104 TaxID=2940590 RepID=UPI002168109A|nr:hypothetical protein [Achromobacter sp. JUb104]MCS3507369.1 hypothetical protein [Achromobacter sp. JUb104]